MSKKKTKTIDYKQERANDFEKVLISKHPRKVVMGSPGTGKTYLLKEAIKRKQKEGKTNFLAITFIGKLGDALADDLAGLAETMTLHGFARKFVLNEYPEGWEYYPKIADIIKEDLHIKKITEFKIGDINYKNRTKYYKAVGEEDIVYYAVQICKKYENKIPKYDLILVDEFQDFNKVEAEFIDLLAKKNEILIIGDDDQALYKFKGSDPKFIRKKFDKSNTDFESHTLRFCSRCTEVIINSFHDIVKYFNNSKLSGRIEKEYICYMPEKKEDSDLNPELLIFKDVMVGLIPYKIKDELSKTIKKQKIKSVLIIGEGRSCRSLLQNVAKKLKAFGFSNIDYKTNRDEIFSFKQHVVEGYNLLSRNPVLAWRLLINEIESEANKKKIILDSYNDANILISALPSEFKRMQEVNAWVLKKILNKPEWEIKLIADSSIEKLEKQIVVDKKQNREMLTNQLVAKNRYLSRPLVNLDITVCNILGSKGLGADVVFLVGFDQGKLPLKRDVEDSEIYQILVALTRASKRIYLINTIGSKISSFIDCIDKRFIKEV